MSEVRASATSVVSHGMSRGFSSPLPTQKELQKEEYLTYFLFAQKKKNFFYNVTGSKKNESAPFFGEY